MIAGPSVSSVSLGPGSAPGSSPLPAPGSMLPHVQIGVGPGLARCPRPPGPLGPEGGAPAAPEEEPLWLPDPGVFDNAARDPGSLPRSVGPPNACHSGQGPAHVSSCGPPSSSGLRPVHKTQTSLQSVCPSVPCRHPRPRLGHHRSRTAPPAGLLAPRPDPRSTRSQSESEPREIHTRHVPLSTCVGGGRGPHFLLHLQSPARLLWVPRNHLRLPPLPPSQGTGLLAPPANPKSPCLRAFARAAPASPRPAASCPSSLCSSVTPSDSSCDHLPTEAVCTLHPVPISCTAVSI